jgi:hypothetical protein
MYRLEESDKKYRVKIPNFFSATAMVCSIKKGKRNKIGRLLALNASSLSTTSSKISGDEISDFLQSATGSICFLRFLITVEK